MTAPRKRGRPYTAEARRDIPVCVKLSPAEAARIDEARGATPRARFMREAALREADDE